MSCSTEYCISNTNHPEYDDNFTSNGDYDGYPSWVGSTNGYYIYFNTTNTQWCLSTSLGGSCLLSGKSPCTSECPDLNDTYFNTGMCLTPTPTPTNNCDVLDFQSFFDCEFDPTPTPTPTTTQTPTITPTPSSTNYCSIVEVVATINSYSPTPTPTPTITPSSSGTINRPCHFYGDVTFNTVNEMINCPISKQFQDCYDGTIYNTINNIINPSGGDITDFMVFNAVVDGLTKCISYIGTTTQISGVNDITLISGPYGYSNLNGCSSCIPTTTSTPTPTPSITPTITPTNTPSPTICFNFTSYINPMTGPYGSYQYSTGSSGYYNGYPYYIIITLSTITGYVWYDTSTFRWRYSTSLGGGGTFSTLTNGLPYPTSNPELWTGALELGSMTSSVFGECITPTPTPTPTPTETSYT